MRVSDECIENYMMQFPEDDIFIEESNNLVAIKDKKTNILYIQPRMENDEEFMDRLKRSKKAQKNLFYKEWETFDYDDYY